MKLPDPGERKNVPPLDGFYPKLTGGVTLNEAMERYLVPEDGSENTTLARMMDLKNNYIQDILKLTARASDPRLDPSALNLFARLATRTESHLFQVLVFAAGHFGPNDQEIRDEVKNTVKTAGKKRNSIGVMAVKAKRAARAKSSAVSHQNAA